MFNATFSNISAIAWRPVLVVEEDFSYIMATSFSGGGSRSTLFQLYHGDQF